VERSAQTPKSRHCAGNQWVTRDPRLAKSRKYFGKNFSFLNFGLGWWKIARGYFMGEIIQAVSAVAERLVGGMAATAQSDGSASGEAELVSGGVDNLEITFHQDWAVMFERNFCWHWFPFKFR
jgi:hypothetical protein